MSRIDFLKTDTAFIKISDKEYHSDKEAVGSSTLKSMMDNPLKGWLEHKNKIEVKQTDALVMGSLIHTLILEPEEFNNRFAIAPDNYKQPSDEMLDKIGDKKVAPYPLEVLTPKGSLSTAKVKKELIEELDSDEDIIYLTPNELANYSYYITNKDKYIISQEMLDNCKTVAQKAIDYKFHITSPNGEVISFDIDKLKTYNIFYPEYVFYAYIHPHTLETSLTPKEDFIKCKCKPDFLVGLDIENKIFACYDLKTAETAGANEIAVKGAGRYYHLQEALYTKILEANGLKIYKFRFLVVGKQEWATAQEYEYDRVAKDLGLDHLRKALKQFKKAKEGVIKEGVFDIETGEYQLEPVVTVPTYMFYK